MNRVCDFLKDSYGFSCCPNYGNSDCPITMGKDKECNITEKFLLEMLNSWHKMN